MSAAFKIGASVYIDDPAKVWHGCIGKVIGIDVGKTPYKVQFDVEGRDSVWRKASAWFPPDRLRVQGDVLNKWTAVLCDKVTPAVKESLSVELTNNPGESNHIPDATQMLDDEYREPCVLDLNNGLIPVEVRDSHDRPWETRTLTAVGHPDASYRFSTEDAFNGGTALGHWKHARLKRAAANHCADANKMVEPVVKESLTTDNPVPGPRKTVLYIAGPMRGIAWFNYPLFDRVARELREAGNEVISPADEDRAEDDFSPFATPAYHDGRNCTFPEHLDFEKTVRRCLEAVLRCDEIVLLPGWERSKGAIAELALAMWLGIPVRFCFESLNIEKQGLGIGPETFAHQLYHSWFVGNTGIDDTDCDEPDCDEPECDDCQTYTEHLAATQDDEDVLDEAARITRGNRSASYGPPDQDFRRTAGMWSALFGAKLKEGVTFEPRDVALAMILLKTSRETHQRKRDNWVDIAGYARCGSLCQ